jgi:transposase InsO family protein
MKQQTLATAAAQGQDVRHILIEPGRTMQNGYIESFKGKFRLWTAGHSLNYVPRRTMAS